MNRLVGAFTIAIGGLFGLFAVTSIVMGEGNTLANVFLYLIIGGCLLAMIAPRPAFVVFLVACGYVDLFKRLMVVSGRVSMDDLYYVLGLAPALLSCIVVSVILRGVIGGMEMTRQHWTLFVAACGVVILNAALSALDPDRSMGKILQGTANGGLYGMLIFVIPMLYRDEEDVLRLFKMLLWIYAPVGIYGVVQQMWGFQDFEVAYLMTGLSIEIKQLFTDRVRAFSTLNSPTALGAISAAFVVLPLFLSTFKNASGTRRMLPLALGVIFSGIFFAAVVASTSRTAFLMVAVMLAGMVCFRTRLGTILFYIAGGGAFIALLVSARFLLDRIELATIKLTEILGNTLSFEAINLNTFSDRLMGFAEVLTNPEAYTWFGHGTSRGIDPRDPLYNHDLLSSTLVRYGAVPLCVLIIATLVFLVWTHGQILGIRDPRRRQIGAGMLALGLSFFAISITSGNVLTIFPVNVFFWLAVTSTILIVSADKAAVRRPAVVSAKAPSTPPLSERRFVSAALPLPQ